MADSVFEKAMKAMKTSLEAVSKANDYSNNYANVQRSNQERSGDVESGNSFADTPFIIFTSLDETPLQGQPVDKFTFDVPVVIGIWFQHDRTDNDYKNKSTDEVINSFVQDLKKWMLTERNKVGGPLGGWAMDLKYQGYDKFEFSDGGDYTGINFNFDVFYRHSDLDPAEL